MDIFKQTQIETQSVEHTTERTPDDTRRNLIEEFLKHREAANLTV